jgi:O-antigen ligase
MWLYVHRPFEVWPALGMIQFERGYMLAMILAWLVSPGKGVTTNRIHAALIFFAMVLLTSWVVSPYASKPGPTEVVDNFCKVAVFYLLVVTTVRDEKKLRLLVLLFLGAVGLYMAHSFYEYLCGRYQYRQGTRRMIGVDVTFGDPNFFASTLLYALPLTLPFWNERPRRLPRWLMLGYISLAILCILLTGSRAGFMGTVLLGVMLYLSSAKRKVLAVLLGGFLAGFAFLALSVALPEDLQNRYLTLVDSSRGPANAQTSAEGRLDGFIWGLYVWQQSPLLGHGPSAFAYATNRGGQAHNLYGQVLSELGVLGAAALLLLVLCFWLNWRETHRLAAGDGAANDFVYQLSRAVTINVLLMLIMGWAGHNLFRYNWQWLAAFSAISVHCLRRRVETAREHAYQYPDARLAVPALQVAG